jgi:stalled ribosome rescue protein Dom34
MTTNAGVWIDHHKAVVVLLTDEGQEMLQILSDRNVSSRSSAGLRPQNSYTPNDFVAEGKREAKVTIQLNEYYDEVIACVRDAQAILILGPGEAKGEFRRRIARQKPGGHIAEMKTVAKLTDQQIADYVRQHFW